MTGSSRHAADDGSSDDDRGPAMYIATEGRGGPSARNTIRDAMTAEDGIILKIADTAMGTARAMIQGTTIGEAVAALGNANGAITRTKDAIVAGGARVTGKS